MAGSKIAPFTLPSPDQCVKCGLEMPKGTECTWLRDGNARIGYYHIECKDKPTIPALTRVKVKDSGSPLGWVWMRVNAIPDTKERYGPQPTALPSLRPMLDKLNDMPLPGAWEVKPAPTPPAPTISAEGILLNALAQQMLPAITKMIAERAPRIVCNIYVAKAGDEVKAMELLSKELFLLQSVSEG